MELHQVKLHQLWQIGLPFSSCRMDKISILNITVIKNGKKESLSLRPKFLILKEPTHTI